MEIHEYLILFKDPMRTCAYLALTMSIISLWIKNSFWIWGSLLIAGLVFASIANVVDPMSIATIGIFGWLAWLFQYVKGKGKIAIGILVIFFSLALWAHKMPGINNMKVAEGVLSPGGIHYNLWFNFDKPLVGLFLLAWVVPIVSSFAQWGKAFKQSFFLIVGGVLLLIVISMKGGLVAWDPKIPRISLLFLWANLFFVCIPEEAFMRGFLQRELCKLLGERLFAKIISVVVIAGIFAGLHFFWIQDPFFLAMVFLAGVIFGSIYEITRVIEASILCHFVFNVTHFFLFTYPILG